MRVLLVSNRFPPHITGGYEYSAWLAAEGLSARGHDVRVLTTVFGVSSPTIEGNVRRRLRRTVESSVPHRLAWLEWRDSFALAHELREFRPDLVSAWNLEGLFPSVVRGVVEAPTPTVVHLHDVFFDGTVKWAREWSAFWRRPAGSMVRGLPKRVTASLAALAGAGSGWPETTAAVRVRHAVYCSESIRQRTEQAGVRAGDWRVVLSGVDTRLFRPVDLSPDRGRLRLLFVGRLHPSKGAHLALEAVSRLGAQGIDGVTLTVLGVVPPDRAYYDDLLRQASIPALREHVVFRTPESNDRMPDVYRSHDVLVFPTLVPEGMPRAPMEAMACGRVVVGTTAGGGAELFVDDVNAVVVPQNDAEAIAVRLAELHRDPERVRRLERGARRHIEAHHSVDRTVDAIERYYLEVVEKARRTHGPRSLVAQ